MAEPVLFAAEWVLPITAAPVRDGVVAVEGTRIAWVGPRRELPSRFLKARLRTFPRSLILPGWVNAHCHLNLTGALGLIPGTADRFADWVRRVIRFRESLPPALVRQSLVAGMDLLAHSGTTTVAHVDMLPELEPFLAHPMRSIVFHEAIGFPAARAEGLLRQAGEWLDQGEEAIRAAGTGRVTLGLAPHAPYTASAPLMQGLAALARERRVPLSVHLSETRAELELLRSGAGQLRELLEERNAWDPDWTPPGVSPVRYLADLGVLEARGLAVHCNYLTDEDLSLLRGGGLRPTWCPGSFQFFGHRDHPAGRLVRAGVPLALGTDSLASNAGLTMLREVRLAAEAHPELPRETWLHAATLGAAEGLGLGAVTGSLEPGKAADIQVLQGVPDETTDPLSPLFRETLRVRSVLVDGAEMKFR
ncbi:MAG: amidohydrolase family protein [Armatimonadota bacterium]